MGDETEADWMSRHARRTDPSTSKAAAASMEHAADSLCGRILEDLKRHGPATQTLIARRLGLDRYQVNKRLPDLRRAEKIEATDLTMPGESGRKQIVWKAKANG